jgi:YggT family protein
VNQQVAQISVIFLYILMAFVFVRTILSWPPLQRNQPLVQIVYSVTEPLLEPVRRIMPRTGMFDFSAMVVIILLQVVVILVQNAAN